MMNRLSSTYYISGKVIKSISLSFLLVLTFLFNSQLQSQELSVLANLPNALKESSGLLVVDERVFTHNDSDGGNYIYEIDETTGIVLRTIEIQGANNVDWEDISQDDTYIYIADIGNNMGNRQDLKIYKILKEEFLNNTSDKVNSEKINFKYKEQADFEPSPYDTNFDAEAIIVLNNQIYLFSKNWKNFETDIYVIPASVGNHEVEKIGTINTEGLITAATYDKELDKIVLTGYGEDVAFVSILSDFTPDDFSNVKQERSDLDIPYGNSFQVEAIDLVDSDNFLLTSEESYSGTATLFNYAINLTLSTKDFEVIEDSIFPNPSSSYVKLKIKNFQEALILDNTGKIIKRSAHKNIYVGDLSAGVYILKVRLRENSSSKTFKLIVK